MRFETKRTLKDMLIWCVTWAGLTTAIGAGIVLGKLLDFWIVILFLA